MAHPIKFAGFTHDFGPPPGLDEMVGRLPVFMNGATVVSAWQLDPDELKAVIDSGGIVFLSIMSGINVFPCYVGSEESTKAVASDTGKVW
jgi:hypothetical protein